MKARTLCSIALALVATVSLAQIQRGDPLPRKGVLGAQLVPATAEEAKAAGLPEDAGVKVVRNLPGLTGERLKLEPNDVIVSIAGEKITRRPLINQLLGRQMAGKPVTVEVFRGGKLVKLTAEVAERPRQRPDGFKVVYDQVVSQGKRIRVIATHPEAPGRYPTIFLIGGIGAYSVDGDFAGIPYGNIIGPLAKSGYATVRIDKPGQGDSEGPMYTDLLFDTELDAYLQALRLAKTLDFVDKDKIVIFGHSMGGAFGPLVAAQEPVAGIVTSGTVVRTWIEYQLENTRRQAILGGASLAELDADMKRQAAISHLMFNEGLSAQEIVDKHPDLAPLLRSMSPDLKTYSGVGIPFFQQLAKKNLPEAWSKTDAKVLALYHENDFITDDYDHELIAQIVNARKPGNGEYKLVPQSDHGFNMTTSQADSRAKWGRPGGQFNPNVVEIISAWLDKHFKPSSR